MKHTLLILSVWMLLFHSPGNAAIIAQYEPSIGPAIGPVREWSFPGYLSSELQFDVDGNGVADYRFLRGANLAVGIFPLRANRLISTGDIGGAMLPVAAGDILGISPTVTNGAWYSGGGTNLYGLQFTDTYLGVEFQAEDGVHYGWIGYTGFGLATFPIYNEDGTIFGYGGQPDILGGVIHSWAWETEPGKAIVVGAVPEPSAAVLCLLCAFGLLRRRR